MRSVYAQLAAAVAAILGGAWLIGLWAFGLALVMFGVAAVADVLFRHSDRWEPQQGTHEAVLERYRRSR